MERADCCKLCLNVFNGYCRPRSLPCGHTFCTTCIDNNIQDKRLTCPKCKITISATSGKYFPINIALEEMIAVSVKVEVGERSRKMQTLIDEQKTSTENLIMESERIREHIKSYNDFLQERKSEHAEALQNIGGLTKQNQAIILQINEEMGRLVEIQKEFEGLRGSVQEKLPSLDRAKSTQVAIAAIDELDKSFAALEKWCKLCQQSMPDANIVTASGKVLSLTKAALSAVDSYKSEGGHQVPDLSRLTILEKLARISQQTTLTVEELFSKPGSYISLLKENKVYAVQFAGGKTRAAKLTLSGNKIYLHCLRDEEPPANVHTIKQNELIKSLNKASTMVFMDLDWQGHVRERVHILLSSDQPLTHQFRLLCSGEHGPSYLHNKFFSGDHKGNYISVTAGDYEYHNGTGGALIVKEFVADASSYGNPNTAGMVYATHGLQDPKKGAQFSIAIKASSFGQGWGTAYTFSSTLQGPNLFGSDCRPNQHHKIVLGHVKDDLDLLTKAAHGNNICQVSVADCGVVLYIK